MAKWDYVKRDFSGGEIDARMWMRDDDPMFGKAVAQMQNFYPTLQGTAVRTPGTRYVVDIPEGSARIIPYYTQANERALVIITPATAPGANDGKMQILPDLTSLVTTSTGLAQQQFSVFAETPVYVQLVRDSLFSSPEQWDATPLSYAGGQGDKMGWDFDKEGILGAACQLRSGAGNQLDAELATISQAITLTQDTASLQIDFQMRVLDNFSSLDGGYGVKIRVGTTLGGGDIYSIEWDQSDHQPWYKFEKQQTIPVSLTGGQVVYFWCELTSNNNEGTSAPLFAWDKCRILALYTVEIGDGLISNVPYTADELQDLQYIQSPYEDSANLSGKYLVITHPSHKPKWLQFTVPNGYEFIDIPFFYVDPSTGSPVNWTPDAWVNGNYPACCASFHGRLMLGGSQAAPIPGSATGSATETVWGTVVGNWAKFSPPEQVEVFPDDSIEFTSIYRSPIQWLYGQKDLLIGALEMEYIASADTIFQPADIGVFMHSTHGSANVQPIGLGQTVVFPAEGGTRLRAMNFQNDDQGYVAPDMSFYNPAMFTTGIKRMVRLRQPHQMVVSLLGNGQLALLHFDPYAKVSGISRLSLNATIKDICVIPDKDGTDVLFMTVLRKGKLQLEALSTWAESSFGEFLQAASFMIVDNTNLIAGLDHLDGQYVEVVGDNNYLGTFPVVFNSVALVDQIGNPINVSQALIGLSYSAKITTLPLVTRDPGAAKRFSKVVVRGLFTSRVIINGERSADRDPSALQGKSQGLDLFADYDVAHLGADRLQYISIEETVPLRSEVIGIFGTVSQNSV